MTEHALIDIENATFFRGRNKVFDGLDLKIEQGELVAILGPNGAGKTTLLKAINREIYPVVDPRARVRILGRSTWNVWELRKEIGIVSDDLQVRYNRKTTAAGVVLSGYFASIGSHGLLASKVTPEQRSRCRDVMQQLGIDSLSEVPLKNMSTGQQRRCLLARALVHQPATLIFDEPTAGLDLAASFDYLARIRRLVAEGRSIVLVTHHLNEIPPDVERVILLRDGKIVADGAKQDVLTVEKLRDTYAVPLRLKIVDGYYLAYPDE